MQIRHALEREVNELSSLVIAAKRHWGYSDAQIDVWRPGLEISVETVSAHRTFVGELNGQIVGFYSLIPSPEAWVLNNLWVLPAFMRRGFGRALLAHAMHTAASGGATFVNIDADPHAEVFYLACGAKRVGVIAAPIAEQPNRIRSQLVLAVTRSNTLFEPVP